MRLCLAGFLQHGGLIAREGGALIELTRNLAVKLADTAAATERLTLVKAAAQTR
jgi:hypothetical protein